jgi:predicted  nucleic acid-binding Zn-ribbon protein
VAISAFDLEVAARPEKGKARCRNSMQNETDPVAMRAYLRELTRLRAERAEARSDEVERINSDIEQVETAIRSASGGSDSGERARGNVSKALAAVRKGLAKGSQAEQEFAKHLHQTLSTGYECMYSLPVAWRWD